MILCQEVPQQYRQRSRDRLPPHAPAPCRAPSQLPLRRKCVSGSGAGRRGAAPRTRPGLGRWPRDRLARTSSRGSANREPRSGRVGAREGNPGETKRGSAEGSEFVLARRTWAAPSAGWALRFLKGKRPMWRRGGCGVPRSYLGYCSLNVYWVCSTVPVLHVKAWQLQGGISNETLRACLRDYPGAGRDKEPQLSVLWSYLLLLRAYRISLNLPDSVKPMPFFLEVKGSSESTQTYSGYKMGGTLGECFLNARSLDTNLNFRWWAGLVDRTVSTLMLSIFMLMEGNVYHLLQFSHYWQC